MLLKLIFKINFILYKTKQLNFKLPRTERVTNTMDL